MLTLTTWTAIAIQPHAPFRGPRWRRVEGAPYTTEEADALHAQGMLLKATRVTAAGTEYVVKTPILLLQSHAKAA